MRLVLGFTDEDAHMQSAHSGVTLESLDNPGWRITISLNGTILEDAPFDAYEDQLSHSEEWLRCWREDLTFHAACGPKRLEDAISMFLVWAKV